MTNERERLRLYDRLGEVLGTDEAGTLMELLPPTSWDDIATRQGVDHVAAALRSEMTELRTELQGEMTELRADLHGEMTELRTDLQGEMTELRTELQGEMTELRAELHGEMTELRADLRLELARGLRLQVAANVASMLALAGLLVGLN